MIITAFITASARYKWNINTQIFFIGMSKEDLERELEELDKEEQELAPDIFSLTESIAEDLYRINKRRLEIIKQLWGKVYLYYANNPIGKDVICEEYREWGSVSGWFDFALPTIDNEIIEEIKEWRKQPDIRKYEKTLEKAKGRGAVLFIFM